MEHGVCDFLKRLLVAVDDIAPACLNCCRWVWRLDLGAEDCGGVWWWDRQAEATARKTHVHPTHWNHARFSRHRPWTSNIHTACFLIVFEP